MLPIEAVEIASEGNAWFGRAKGEPVRVTGEMGGSVTREQINLVPGRTQGEAVGGAGVEIRFAENEEAAARNQGVVGDAELVRAIEIIGQKPTPDIRRGGGWIVQFDTVELPELGAG